MLKRVTSREPAELAQPIARQRVAICVCTCRRPKLLEQCLDSLAEQITDPSLDVRIIVVSNGGGLVQETRAVVARFQERSPFPVTFAHEFQQNISTARNTAMFRALSLGADWVAFIDDDEIADPDWIANLMAPEWRRYPVLMGANIYRYPDPAPFWVIDKNSEGIDNSDEGLLCKTASSGNVRFHVALVRAGLSFDERLGLSGGEDNDFFSRAHEQGFQISRTYRAITRESVHAERLTYRAQVYRAYWCAASDMRRFAVHKGWPLAILRKLLTVPTNAVFGLFWLLASLPAAAFSRRAFKKFALRGGKKIAKAIGRAVAMLGHTPKPYRVIHGS